MRRSGRGWRLGKLAFPGFCADLRSKLSNLKPAMALRFTGCARAAGVTTRVRKIDS